MYPDTLDGSEALLAGAPEDEVSDGESPTQQAQSPSLRPVVSIALLALLVGAIALGLTGTLWHDTNNHNAHSIDLVCNRGLNTGLELPLCASVPGPEGIPLLSGDADDPDTVYALRAHEGVGINLTHVPNSHVTVSARIESLSDMIVLDKAPDSNALTVDFLPNLINLTDACDITCEANFFMRLANGADGYGFALGTDHVFANDNSHRTSSILGGRQNTLIMSNGSVIVGGRFNTIRDTRCAMIGVGRNNTVLNQRSVIVIGEYNTIMSDDSFIGSGQMNTIISQYEGNAIVSGSQNVVSNSSRSIIGSGEENSVDLSDDSGIYCGRGNSVANSTASLVGAGEDNVVGSSASSGVVVGIGNSVQGSLSSAIVAGYLNIINNAKTSFIGAGRDNIISLAGAIDDPFVDYGCAIVAGHENLLNGSIATTLIGAGAFNDIMGTVSRSAVIAGVYNTFAGDAIEDALVGVGEGNDIRGRIRRVAILTGFNNVIGQFNASYVENAVICAGTQNQILGDTGDFYNFALRDVFIGAGILNYVYQAGQSAIVAGGGNNITFGQLIFIGAGQYNAITTEHVTYGSAIVAGLNNTIFGGVWNSFIGSGAYNLISDDNNLAGLNDCLVGAGSNNTILGDSQGLVVGGQTGVVVGSNNYIYSSLRALIGAGEFNVMTFATSSAIVAGTGNVIERTGTTLDDTNLPRSISVLIGAGDGNFVRDSDSVAIAAGLDNSVVNSTGVFLGVGNSVLVNGSQYASVLAADGASVNNVQYASVLAAGPGFQIEGALDSFTAHASNLHSAGSWRTSGISVISGDMTFGLGDHLLLANAATATVHLPGFGSVPDGLVLRFRDVTDASANPVTLSCVVSACNLQRPNAASAPSGTDLINTQYATRFYVYYASSNTWIAF